ncbi:MAG TPA: efflux RND transporter periplasmic adaptor subunit [Burkholderiaceae bacterium]|nr:efflux RND transporter periplasmic adaptor subunit [Burkholderiaceae bacterium]
MKNEHLEALLGSTQAPPAWRRRLPWLGIVALGVLALTFLFWQQHRGTGATTQFVTEPVVRGKLMVTVTANGTLQPIDKADIGSELSGTVARVFVDVNDRVKRGQVLAELDTDKLRDQAARSRALLSVAEARVRQADATLAESRDSRARLREVARLSGGQVPSQAELAAGEAAVARAEADLASARASVRDADAARRVDETNLRKASIRSPIDGVVLARSVDPGNAVAASLQAVTLFTLAKDLARMKLDVNIDEADVGQVRTGQQASFTVSAWPNRNYSASVTRVNYGSTTKDNVVTYIAELVVNNDDLSLRPGMTATAVIASDVRTDVMLVPNAALRFTPTASNAATKGRSLASRLMPRPPPSPPRHAGTVAGGARQVWVLREGQPVALPVVPGATDGRITEVSSDALKPGMAVIVEQSNGGAR